MPDLGLLSCKSRPFGVAVIEGVTQFVAVISHCDT
jgi:hypothetical protein